jgi:hypothetical protein
MRRIIAFAAILYSTVALAQSAAPPPADSGQPAVRAKPAKQAKAKAPAKDSVAVRLQACQDIDDGTKERLNCYDEVIPPAPKPKAAAAKTVMDCKFTKEEDERLACYNGFVDNMPKLPKS